ncbi:MAG: hypothetical protein ACLSBB_17585 [Ruthenibacterium lactatiformans]
MSWPATVDRLPAIEWAYWWDKTLELWYGQGLPRGLDEAAMADFVGIDRNTQFWLPHKIPDCPRETSHGRGIVEMNRTMSVCARIFCRRMLCSRCCLRFGKRFHSMRMARPLSGILWTAFWWPRTLLGIEDHLYSFYDQPELYHRICEDLLEWRSRRWTPLARYEASFMTIAEDMSYNHGPMLRRTFQ